MKVSRWFTVMAALVMLLSVIQPPAQAATSQGSSPYREEWSDWEIIRQPTCTEPGLRTRSSNMGTSERESIPAAGHQYGPWALTQEATCQQPARETHTCRVCGHSEWRVSGGLGPHQWSEWTVVREPAPGAPGLRQRQCAVCGVTFQTNKVKALGHVDENQDAKCDRCSTSMAFDGSPTDVCKVCGRVHNLNLADRHFQQAH